MGLEQFLSKTDLLLYTKLLQPAVDTAAEAAAHIGMAGHLTRQTGIGEESAI